MAMPATSPWCHGRVPSKRGNQEPAVVTYDGGGLKVLSAAVMGDRSSHSNLTITRKPPSTQRCAQYVGERRLMLSGDVHPNPGPTLKCLQWNCSGLSKVKREALRHVLDETHIDIVFLQELHMTEVEARSFSLPGFQHVSQARNVQGGGTAIMTRDSLVTGIGSSCLEPEVELVTAKVYFGTESISLLSAYFPRGSGVSEATLHHLIPPNGPTVFCIYANSHHP